MQITVLQNKIQYVYCLYIINYNIYYFILSEARIEFIHEY